MWYTKKNSKTTPRSKLHMNYMYKGEIDETILPMIVFFWKCFLRFVQTSKKLPLLLSTQHYGWQ
jgi:hypothetical protein